MNPIRRNLLRGAVAVAALGAAGGARAAPRAIASETDYLDAVFTDLAGRYLIRQPEQATRLGLDHDAREGLKSVLADASVSHAETDIVYCERGLAKLADVDAVALPATARFDLAVIVSALELGRGGGRFQFGDNTLHAAMNAAAAPYVVSAHSGAYQSVPEFLDAQHKVLSEDDADAYYSRVHEMSRALAQETDRIVRDAARGVTPPGFILDHVIQRQTGMLRTPAAQSRLVRTLAVQCARQDLKGEQVEGVERLVERQVYPALARQMDALKTLRGAADDAVSVERLPDGEAYYNWLLAVGTSSALKAPEIHRIGLEQTAALGAQMDALLRAGGMTRGSVGARMRSIARDPGLSAKPPAGAFAGRPLIRTLLGGFNGYVEGRRLNTRRRDEEAAAEADSWVERLGNLQARRLAAMRLVLDTGLHTRGWSRARAINWAARQSGGAPGAIVSEVDRCCALPGQACGGAVGDREISRLRAKARTALGPAFDFQRFDNLLVEAGPAPLGLLEAALDRGVAAWRDV